MVPGSKVELRNKQAKSSSAHLSVTLKWTTRLLVYINHFTVRITWQVDPNVNINLGHLLINLGL